MDESALLVNRIMSSSEKTDDSSDDSQALIQILLMKNGLKHDPNLLISPNKGQKVIHDSSIHYLAGEPVVGCEGAHAVGEDHDGRVVVGLVRRLREGGEIGKEWIEFIWKELEFRHRVQSPVLARFYG